MPCLSLSMFISPFPSDSLASTFALRETSERYAQGVASGDTRVSIAQGVIAMRGVNTVSAGQ